jgi:XTP/dITP diphosphohydrolase
MIPQLVVATRNPHKVREIERLLRAPVILNDAQHREGSPPGEGDSSPRPARFGMTAARILSLADYPQVPEVPETGDTFAENARAKAIAVARATGKWAIADDSGLEVDALGGRPGTRSRRFAGEQATDADRIARVLALMADVPDEQRTARFRCAIAIAEPSGTVHEVSGTCEGSIAREPRGSSGFGYDPVFVPAGETRTMAQMSLDEKNAISHRGRALRAAMEVLRRLWG